MSDVVVIGAGPYGLSIAAHLRRAGLGVQVFGDVMASWRRHMPAGMYLKSTPDASSLSAPTAGSTIFDYAAEAGSDALIREKAIPIELFTEYGDWFAARHVPDVDPAQVVSVARVGHGFELHVDSGSAIRTEAVVVACGVIPHAYVPEEFDPIAPDGPSRDGLLSHTAQYSDLSCFAGRRVGIVGGGQSALESAALLAEAGADAHVLVRQPDVLWGLAPNDDPNRWVQRLLKPHSGLGEGWSLRTLSGAPGMVRFLPARARHALVKTVLGPSGAWWLRDRVEGRVDLRVNAPVVAARPEGAGVRLELGTVSGGIETLDVDHVLAATGYRVSLDKLSFLSPEVNRAVRRTGGSPTLNASFESSVPGLYFSGLTAAATFGPLLRFVYGTEFASRRIGAALPVRIRRVAV